MNRTTFTVLFFLPNDEQYFCGDAIFCFESDYFIDIYHNLYDVIDGIKERYIREFLPRIKRVEKEGTINYWPVEPTIEILVNGIPKYYMTDYKYEEVCREVTSLVESIEKYIKDWKKNIKKN